MYIVMKFDRLFLNNLVYITSQAPPLKNLHVQFLHKEVQLMKLPRVFQKFYNNSVGPLTSNTTIITTCL